MYYQDMPRPPISVLVIESHALLREALCTVIESEPGLRLAGQAASVETLPVIALSEVDLALLSVSGYSPAQARQEIDRLREHLPQARLLMLAPDGPSDPQQAARLYGVQAVLTQPVSHERLVQTLLGFENC